MEQNLHGELDSLFLLTKCLPFYKIQVISNLLYKLHSKSRTRRQWDYPWTQLTNMLGFVKIWKYLLIYFICFKIIFLVCKSVLPADVCVYEPHVCLATARSQKMASDPLELESWTTTWVLRTATKSSERLSSTVTTEPTLQLLHMKYFMPYSLRLDVWV